ncbi:MAG: hypothetical protein KY468_07000 [Armatimonadetes bacterium]|nr:hypothetical protein [Armatimonadota bacterium]
MSDLLTHWAVFDDSRRLAACDSMMEPLFNRLLEESDPARLGAITRYGSQWIPRILKSAAKDREASESDEKAQQRIAFALGGILHFPADQIFKPLMSELTQADWDSTHHLMQGRQPGPGTVQDKVSIREISAYYDCHVFRKVYLAGHEEPFSRFFVTENATEPGQELEAFVRALFQRALLSSHTLHPDMNDFDGWLDNVLSRIQPLYIDIGLYVRVFHQPDPQKMEAYRVETAFYRDEDPVIRLARAVQRGHRPGKEELDAAVDSPENRSGYATCLSMGVRLMREASAFWRGEVPEPPDVKQSHLWRKKK